MQTNSVLSIVTLLGCTLTQPAAHGTAAREWDFHSLDGVKVVNGTADLTTYRGRQAVHLVPSPQHQGADDNVLAILSDSDFANGTIEGDVAGAPRAGVPADSRGFIGIAFRVQAEGRRYENLYVRPTNGRADDQLRRNHSAQYTSEPDFPWQRLREESPGKYEAYVDLEPSVWTHLRLVVAGRRAELYVNGAAQPCLIVNDLKLGDTHGAVALWAHASTDAYFSSLTIRQR